jgi:pantothenate kinase
VPEVARLDDVELLASRLSALHRPGTRTVLGLTGPPGSGKSTTAARIVEATGPLAVALPMDGFHLAQRELERLGRADRKGAPDTFDAAGFVALLRRLREPARATVYAPEFVRAIEDSIAGAIPVEARHDVVVVEGNYLLLDSGEWEPLGGLLDEVWYIEIAEKVRLERLLSRHVAYGRSPAEAEAWVLGNDEPNAELIRRSRPRAHLILSEPTT